MNAYVKKYIYEYVRRRRKHKTQNPNASASALVALHVGSADSEKTKEEGRRRIQKDKEWMILGKLGRKPGMNVDPPTNLDYEPKIDKSQVT